MSATEGRLLLPLAIPSPEVLGARAAKIADPHRAFHVRSMLPTPSALCARCGTIDFANH